MNTVSIYYRWMGALSLVFICIAVVVYALYREDYKNSLPTPIPENISVKPIGYSTTYKTKGKITLLHFFNPNCPCSKFNTKHIEELYRNYNSSIDFIAFATEKPEENYPIPMVIDTEKKMAESMGIYSTPQAVLLDADGKILYRGNYNQSRYCSNKNTAFVQLAIENALKNKDSQSLVNKSGMPYGCSLFND